MIELKSAIKVYRTRDVATNALNGVDLCIERGEFVAVMGPSGCGKSTLLSIIGMLDTLTDGSYRFDKTDVSTASEGAMAGYRRGNIGYIFQNFNLLNAKSVLQNVMLPLRFSKLKRDEKEKAAMRALDSVELAHRAGHKPPQLSGGQQQRVAIARAMVMGPKLLLADEPTGNLDSGLSAKIMGILKAINAAGTTVLMVSHSQEDVASASRILNMRDGRVQ